MSELTGLRVAVLATDGFEEPELTEPVKALKEAGAQVTIVSPRSGEIQGVRHDIDRTIKVKVDRTLKDAGADEFDAVHLPGGTLNADAMRMVPEVQAFLQAMQDGGFDCAVIPYDMCTVAEALGRGVSLYDASEDILYPTVPNKWPTLADVNIPKDYLKAARMPMVRELRLAGSSVVRMRTPALPPIAARACSTFSGSSSGRTSTISSAPAASHERTALASTTGSSRKAGATTVTGSVWSPRVGS